MSRHKIERRYRKMQADAKAFGAELLTEGAFSLTMTTSIACGTAAISAA